MSETVNQNRQSPVVDADFDDLNFSETDTPGASVPPPRRKSVTGWLWFLLLLAAAGAAAAGYWYFTSQLGAGAVDTAPGGDALSSLRRETSAELATTRDNLAELEERVAAVESGGGNDEELASLRESLAELGEQVAAADSFESRLQSVESALARLEGTSTDARNVFLRAEAEYYMQIANAQLQLAGNPELAALALAQADDRLAELADPALTEVRSALADELTSLEAMEKRDIAGVTLTLGSLAQVVESLPVRSPDSGAKNEAAVPADDVGGAGRAWNSVKKAFAGVIEYTPPADANRPLLTPGSEPMIRSNLALQLQAARLALLRGEQELFRQSLDDAERWLDTYFDTKSAPVQSALDTVRDVREEYGQVERPDISGSLRLLRQLRAESTR